MDKRYPEETSKQTATNDHSDRADANVERDKSTGGKTPGWANLGAITALVFYVVVKLEKYAPDWREQVWRIYVVESNGLLVILIALSSLAFLEPEHTETHWLKWATWLGHKTMTTIFGFMVFALLFGSVFVKLGERKNAATPPPEKSSPTKPDSIKPPTPTTTSSFPVAPTPGAHPDV